jgi:hypothetical protein
MGFSPRARRLSLRAPTGVATEAPAGVLVQYVEEAEGAQRQDGGFRRYNRQFMHNPG